MTARSVSRPAISALSLLQVERSKARARAWRGRRDVGGVGGGVAITRCDISGVGVAGDDPRVDIDVCRRVAVRQLMSVANQDGNRSFLLVLGRDGVFISSVALRRRALVALGEGASMFMDPGLNGGTFSLFESPSTAVTDTRGRFGFGVESGVWSCWSHCMVTGGIGELLS